MSERKRSMKSSRSSGIGDRGSGIRSFCLLSPVSCLLFSVFCLLSVTSCRQDMHNQPKYRPLRATTFFRDGSSARPLVEGTVARGTLQEDEAFFTGKVGGTPVTELPF